MTLYQIIYVATNIFTLYTIYCFFGAFFKSKKKAKWQPAAYVLYFLLTTVVYLTFDLPLFNMIVSLVTIFVITLSYKDSLRKRMLATCYMYMIMFIAEMLAVAITGKILIGILEQGNYNLVHGIFISKILAFGMVIVIKNILEVRGKDSPPIAIFVASGAIPVCTIAIDIIYVGTPSITKKNVIITLILLMIVNAVAFILFDMLSASYHQLLLDRVAKKERQYFLNQCVLMQQAAEDTRKIRHDIKNHYAVLQEFLQTDDTEKVKEYLATLISSENKLRYIYSQTGNIVVDSIINYKLSVIKDDSVQLDIDNTIPTELPMEMTDLSVILSNLLDNSLMAMSKLKDDKKLIIKLVYEKNMLAITVSNTFDGKVNYINGQLTTLKEDNKNHGYGLKNVKDAIEKYDGLLNVTHDMAMFTVEAMLYL